jgi:glycosyltransferase involved in cell wall biosynthesis
MRAVVVSEHLGPPLDEGIRKFATSLIAGLDAYCDAIGLATSECPSPAEAGEGLGVRVYPAPGGKFFAGDGLRTALQHAWPDLIVYVPSASGTLFSFWRARALKRICPDAHVSMVLTQTRRHTAVSRRLVRAWAPDSVFCQSEANCRYLASLGFEARFLPSGVDLITFRPVSQVTKDHLRVKFRLPLDEYLVLHAGHLTPGRNARLLSKLEGVGRGVMLAGRSAGYDSVLKQQLEADGVIVIDRYVDRVEEMYQAVDCYLFPTREGDAAMEFPLSVVEAMACDLPVVAYPYGGLPLALESRDGLWFARSDNEMLDAIARSKHTHANTRAQAEQFDWQRIAAMILEAAEVKDAGAIVAGV